MNKSVKKITLSKKSFWLLKIDRTLDLAGKEAVKLSLRIYPSQNQKYSCQKLFIRTKRILSIILFKQFFLGCHIACNVSVLQLKFSKAGQACKYPNRPTIRIKRRGGKNHLKLPVFLGVKGFGKLCVWYVCLPVSVRAVWLEFWEAEQIKRDLFLCLWGLWGWFSVSENC